MNETHRCTTTAFAPYGIADGTDLLHRTYQRMALEEAEPERVDDRTIDRLETAFRTAFSELSGGTGIPPLVEAAVEDDLYFTRERHAGHEVDLRTELVPSFYREVTGFHCAFRGH